jgi:hypothetical protein
LHDGGSLLGGGGGLGAAAAGLLEPSREWGGDGGGRSALISREEGRGGATRVAGELTGAEWGGESLDGHSDRHGDSGGPRFDATGSASVAAPFSAGAGPTPAAPAGRQSTLLALQRGAAAPGVSSPALSSLAALSAVPPRRPSGTGSGGAGSSRSAGSEGAPAIALRSPGVPQRQAAALPNGAPAPPGSLVAMMRAVEHQAAARDRDASAWKRTLQPQPPAVSAASAIRGPSSLSGVRSDGRAESGSASAAALDSRPSHEPTAVSAAAASPALTFPAPQPAGASGFFSTLARPPAASGSAGVGAMPTPPAAVPGPAQLPALPAAFTPLSALPSVLPSLTALGAAGGSGIGSSGAGAASQSASKRNGHSKHSRHRHHSSHKHESDRHDTRSGRTEREAAGK